MGAPFWFEMLKKFIALKGSAGGGSSSSPTSQPPPPSEPKQSAFEIKPVSQPSSGAPASTDSEDDEGPEEEPDEK